MAKTDSPLHKRLFPIDIRSIDRSVWAVTFSEKSSINTNTKSTMGFPMSLRWTAYVASTPPKGGLKTQSGRFCFKISTIICDNFETVRDSM